MSKVFYARYYSTGELADSDCHALISVPTTKIIKGCTIELNVINDPTLTGLVMKIYSTDGNRNPVALLATSTNSWTLAQIKAYYDNNALAYARKELFFNFDDFQLIGDQLYAFSLQAATYTGTINSHISWGLDFSDSLTTHEVAPNNDLFKSGMRISLIGSV